MILEACQVILVTFIRYTEDMELDDAILDSVKRLELVKTQRPNLESVFFFLRFKMFKTSTI